MMSLSSEHSTQNGLICNLTRGQFILGNMESVWPLGLEIMNSFPSDIILEFGASNSKSIGAQRVE